MSGFGYNILGFGGGGPPPIPEVDDKFNLVSFLSHFDGANNGVNNAFDDGSASNHTITAVANSTQGSFGPFARPEGEFGVEFGGNSGTRKGLKLCDGYQAELVMTGTFTIEFWLFHRYYNGYQSFFGSGGGYSGWAANIGHEIIAFCGPDSKMYCQFWNGSALINTEARAITLNEGEWNHVAVVNNGGDWTYYLNGTGNTTTTFGNVGAITSTGTWASYIGGNHGSGDSTPCRGVMSNVRFVKGTAVYTSNFTPPTAPLTAITNTSSLVAQNNRFIDNSSHANTLSTAGVCKVSAFGPFLTDAAYNAGVNGASAYFGGTGDYISAANSAEFYMDDAAYTIEFWSFDSPPSSQYVFDNYAGGSAGGMNLYLTTAGKIGFRFSSTTDSYKDHDTGDGAFIKGSWNHIAIVRTYASSNTTLVTYANGVAKKTTTFNGITAKINTSEILTIGDAFQGYITDFRLVKGTAVYTGNFTPPTAPLTAITNTKLLLNMADGQAIDSAAQNNLELIGNAKLSNTQAKFGGTSLSLDGTGDYATAANNPSFNFSTGDFTVEMFVYATAIGGGSENVILDTRASNSDAGLVIYSSNSAVLSVTSSGAVRATAGTISTNQWIHVAVVRSSGTLTAYINGTGGTGASYSSAITSPGPFRIGVHENGGSTWQGFIDEYRVSNTARYTSNFTAPSEPFPSQGQL